MSEQEIAKLETRLHEIRTTLTDKEWSDPAYLIRLAGGLEQEDLPIAMRLAQRAHNLRPDGPVIKNKLQEYQQRLQQQQQAVMTSSSNMPQDIHLSNNAESEIRHSKAKPTVNQPVASLFNWKNALSWFEMLHSSKQLRIPFILLVVIPSFLFSFYQIFWASKRFESEAQLIIKQPSSSVPDPTSILLGGLGIGNSLQDTELLQKYIYSTDLINYLDKKIELRKHYSSHQADFFSRLHHWDTREDFYNFYKNHITVYIDEKSGVITIKGQAFAEDYANQLTQLITERAEWYINEIGHTLAKKRIAFIENEYHRIEDNLANAQRKLLNFQQKYGLVDPSAESSAMQQITYNLEEQIAAKQAEYKSFRSVMSMNAPQVKRVEAELGGLKQQLHSERERLANSEQGNVSVSEILAKYTDHKVAFDLALQAYTASQVSLEQARIDAYRQMKYLVVVQNPTLPESSQYPEIIYNISLFSFVLAMLFGVGRIVVLTVKELK